MSSEARALLIIGNYNYSSWSLRAWLTATMSGLDFEVLRLPMDTPTFKEEVSRYSPTGCVPVLQHAGVTVWDSLAICEYLAERFPGAHLWPEDRAARACARAVSAEMHSGFSALRSEMPMNCRASGRQVPIAGVLQWDIERVSEIWSGALEASGGPFLFGGFSIADAMYAPVVLRFETYGVEQGETLGAYRASILALEAMQTWISRARAETQVIAQEEVGLKNSS